MKPTILISIVVAVLILGGFFLFSSRSQFDLPQGVTEPLHTNEEGESMIKNEKTNETNSQIGDSKTTSSRRTHTREVFVTDGVKHSIPLHEILSGGPAKDGIPSIDNPKFIDVIEANSYVANDSVGLGITINGESRFYPYNILVWHEIVNDTIAGEPVLVTYCPLCATGIVFERKVNGKVQEFGVSGRLWQSNLLMYNRA